MTDPPEPQFWVGTSGYNYPEWKGSFYPEKFSSKKMLPYYAERLPTVEINYTFYRMPTERLLTGWSEITPPTFRFTLKAPRRITHDARLRRCEEMTSAFFALAIVAIIVSVDLLLSTLAAYLDLDNPAGLLETALTLTIDPRILAVAVGGTLLLVVAGSAYKAAKLWGGGRVVAEHLGGRRLNPDTTAPTERQLLNVVEEMAIASGTSVPPVYLLESEENINAFAAGYSLDDAVIGITRGTAERLSRDELQGVVAHEFSHVLNGDMRLNLRLIGLLHGIMLLALVGQFVFRIVAHSGMTRRGRREDSPVPVLAIGALVLGAGLMAIGFVGTFFGSIIKAAVSRQREYLADASAVQFTRNPEGIAGALKKIGGLTQGAHVDNPNAPEMSHLFFGQATSGLTSMFSTHPPLAERIGRLDPEWNGSSSSRAWRPRYRDAQRLR